MNLILFIFPQGIDRVWRERWTWKTRAPSKFFWESFYSYCKSLSLCSWNQAHRRMEGPGRGFLVFPFPLLRAFLKPVAVEIRRAVITWKKVPEGWGPLLFTPQDSLAMGGASLKSCPPIGSPLITSCLLAQSPCCCHLPRPLGPPPRSKMHSPEWRCSDAFWWKDTLPVSSSLSVFSFSPEIMLENLH